MSLSSTSPYAARLWVVGFGKNVSIFIYLQFTFRTANDIPICIIIIFSSGKSGELLLCFLRFINVSTYMAKLPWWIQGHSLDFEVHHFHLSRPAPLLSRSIWSTWLTRGGGEQMLPWEKVRPKYLAAATPPLSVVDFHRKSTRWLANWCKFIILYKSSPFLVFIRWKMGQSAGKEESDD